MGVRMQSMSHDNAFKREKAPKPDGRDNSGHGNSGASPYGKPDVYEEQEDQWAVLRHEVEVEDMKRQDERVRSSWEQRDTEEDSITSPSLADEALEKAQ